MARPGTTPAEIEDVLRNVVGVLGEGATVRACQARLNEMGIACSKNTVARALGSIRTAGVVKLVEQSSAAIIRQAKRQVAQPVEAMPEAIETNREPLHHIDTAINDMAKMVSTAARTITITKASELAAVAGALGQLALAASEIRQANRDMQREIDAEEGGPRGMRVVNAAPVETAISQAFRTVEGGKA